MNGIDYMIGNADRMQWRDTDNPAASEVITEVIRQRLMQGFPPGWEDRYNTFFRDGWIYVYRSEYIICRFLLTKVEDGTIRISNFQSSGQKTDDEANAINQVLYSVRYHWDRLRPRTESVNQDIDTSNMCSQLQKKMFDIGGVYHQLWKMIQKDPELTAVVRSRQLHVYHNGKKVLILKGKAEPQIVREDPICDLLKRQL